ncbi:pyruvate dehydrogenase complex E1 component subunit beta [Amaricoccus sp.]|uniref:pyruvate dehydrogenase complex E1 component subunit beta n=1 Tax=Amaricoccus sp. TaxID=1872485 RepID=UPI0026133239|nr:pyruvate dehydrogenase complex E1 component subunit beta [Amaricoccus sp.]HRO10986.1 pyruvate dehydrogenase complex E1 component subunit beta [Amaricoccus sp.]
MATQILMPALSPTMEEGTLAKWLVKEGDSVTSGQIIAEIETDKATMEFEAVDEGTVGKILIDEGTEGVKVNTPIAVLLEEGEDASAAAAAPAAPAAEKPAAEAKAAPAPTAPAEAAAPKAAPEVPEGTKFRSQTVREALRDAMAEEMRRDGDVFLMGEEVAEYQGAYKISQGLLEEFGARRVIDTPITEHGFAGLAVGAAFAGLKPIVEFMTFNFALQAIDHIINSAAKTLYMSGGQMGSPMVFRGPNGAAARVAAQHSHDFAATYAQVPGLKVVQPYTAADAKGLLKSAIRDRNPVIVLENEILYGRSFDVPELDDFTVPIGKARIAREGSDLTIVSFGIGMTYALQAADELAKEGISAEVIDLRSLRPMDTETVIASVRKTNRCVTVEEGFPVCSIGSYLSSVLMEKAFDYLDAPVLNCTGKDVPMPYAANLEKLALVTTAEVIAACKAVTYR